MNYEETISMLTRRMVWDLACHYSIVETLQACDMVPGSDDLLSLEHAESHLRQRPLAPQRELIATLSALATEAISATILPPHEDLPEGFADTFDDIGPEIIRAGVHAVLAQLIALNVVSMQTTQRGWFRV